MRVKVYIAGPYSSGDVGENVHNAMLTADRILDAGLIPYCPHLWHYQHIMTPRPQSEWLGLVMEWISMCNCIIRMPGDSAGADLEVDYAKQCGLRVYHHLHDLLAAETIPAVPSYDCEGGGP